MQPMPCHCTGILHHFIRSGSTILMRCGTIVSLTAAVGARVNSDSLSLQRCT